MTSTTTGPLWTVGAVAERLGVAVPTLRSWELRYGLGPSLRSPGGHRRYTDADVRLLGRVVELTGDGVPLATAVSAAAELMASPVADRPPAGPGQTAAAQAPSGYSGSGTIDLGSAGPVVRGLARDAARLDVDAVRRRVGALITDDSVETAWAQVLTPLLQRIGAAYTADPEPTVPVEHAATAGLLAALQSIPPAAQRGRLPALLACAPDEQHSLPLEALRAALAQHGVASRFLGPRVPADSLQRAVGRLRPSATVVWAHRRSLGRQVPVGVVAERSRLLLAGPGWRDSDAADATSAARAVLLVSSLTEAVALVRQSGLSRR